MEKILFVVNGYRYFKTHRLQLALRLIECGYEVHLAAPDCDRLDCEKYRIISHTIPLKRKSFNFLYDITLLIEIIKIFSRVKPKIVHLITIKCYLYGGIASRVLKIPGMVVAVAGLGSFLTESNLRYKVMRALLRPAFVFIFKHPNKMVIFQNANDMSVFSGYAKIAPQHSSLIRGAGVDLDLYKATDFDDEIFTVAFASRLLKEKGILDLIEAVKLVRDKDINICLNIAGPIDPGNPGAISKETLDALLEDGVINYVGELESVQALFEQCHAVALPSYYGEGLPKILLEAAACGKAVVTTDHPGCRDAIEPGITGILVEPKNVSDIVNALLELNQNRNRTKDMGRAGRRLAEAEFSIDTVWQHHLRLYRSLGLK